ncbi:MAG: FAD-dependent oxidoreductase [Pseudomonadota bacterium]
MIKTPLSQLNVVIVGAGIAGSCAALALRQRGAQVTLLERSSQAIDAGAGLQIPSCATRVLRALGLGAQLDAIASVPAQLHFREAFSGRIVINGAPNNDQSDCPHYQAHRADVHSMLLDSATEQGAAVEWGASVADVAQQKDVAIVSLDDGRQLRADLVIGADGIRSTVRQQLFGDQKAEFTGNIAYRAMIDASQLPRPVAAGVFLGPDAHFVIYPLRDGRCVNVVAQCRSADWRDESWMAQGDREELRQTYAGWHEDVELLLAAMQETYQWGLFTRTPMARWSIGRIGLIGDACHPSLPNLGAGAALAMEDAYVLADLLARFPDRPEHAFDILHKLRIKRCSKVQRVSRSNSELFHMRNPLRRWLTYRALSLVTKALPRAIPRQLSWLQDYDASTVVESM